MRIQPLSAKLARTPPLPGFMMRHVAPLLALCRQAIDPGKIEQMMNGVKKGTTASSNDVRHIALKDVRIGIIKQLGAEDDAI